MLCHLFGQKLKMYKAEQLFGKQRTGTLQFYIPLIYFYRLEQYSPTSCLVGYGLSAPSWTPPPCPTTSRRARRYSGNCALSSKLPAQSHNFRSKWMYLLLASLFIIVESYTKKAFLRCRISKFSFHLYDDTGNVIR